MYEHLKYTKENGLAIITMNRPEAYNAINEKISYELQDAFKQAGRDAEVRAVMLAAEGKGFCSGQDLKEIAGKTDRSLADSLHKRYNPIIRLMRNMPKPIIAKVQGVAAGAGCSLALACDYIIAAEEVNFIEIFINIGLVPDSGSSWLLVKRVGLTKAFEMASLANRVNAKEAVEIGLINRAVPAAELDAAAMEIAMRYAQGPTKGLGLIKKMLDKAATSSLDEMLDYEAYCQEIASRSEDYRESVQAFNEKRQPVYKGQ